MSGIATYAQTQLGDQDELVERYAPLVKRIAYHLIGRLPASVQPDDLMQAGMIGLLEAARNYDAGQGASFETYAGIRVRGAMLDEVRRNDWAPRSVHRKVRALSEAVNRVESSKGRDARDTEIAEALGLSLDEYFSILKDISGYRVLSFEDVGLDEERLIDDQGNAIDHLEAEGIKRMLADAISGLPEKERLVLALYYDEELNLREIGEVFGVTESRICQIHSQALVRLQARMGNEAEQGQLT